MNLTSIDICSVEEFLLLTRNRLELKVYSRVGFFKINISGLVFFNMSNDDFGKDDNITIIDVLHEFRRVTTKDLERCQYMYEADDFNEPMHIIKLEGCSLIEVICSGVGIESMHYD